MTRTEIINALIKKHSYKKYLEIGVRNPTHNFNAIEAEHKVGVDPATTAQATHCMTSDEFFRQNSQDFDLIFVDGLHHAEQAYKDVINGLNCLAEGGSIVVHDCKPRSYEAQLVPRVQTVWNGDVWKAWVLLRFKRDDLTMFVVDADEGCGVIQKGEQLPIEIQGQLSYDNLVENMQEWLNLFSVEQFQEWLQSTPETAPAG